MSYTCSHLELEFIMKLFISKIPENSRTGVVELPPLPQFVPQCLLSCHYMHL